MLSLSGACGRKPLQVGDTGFHQTPHKITLVALVVIVWQPMSLLGEERIEQPVCCGAAQIASDESSSNSDSTSALAPRLTASEITQLRFPDVRITSAVHHDANPDSNVVPPRLD